MNDDVNDDTTGSQRAGQDLDAMPSTRNSGQVTSGTSTNSGSHRFVVRTVAVPVGGARDEWGDAEQVAEGFLLGYADRTARAYRTDLKDFFTYASAIGVAPLRFSAHGLELYAKHLTSGRQLAASTVARRLSALSGFFEYAVAEEHLERNPMLRVRRPRVPQESQALGLSRDEIVLMLQAAEQHSARAHAFIALLVGNGLRIGEVLGADAADIGAHRGMPTLRVRRKGNRLAVVPLADLTAGAVTAYLAGRVQGPLILSKSGRRLDAGSANALLRRVARQVLTPHRADGLHAHLARHGWVAALLDAGVPLHEVMAAAGHRSPTVTMRYDRSRAELSRTHPTFRLADWLAQDRPGDAPVRGLRGPRPDPAA